MNIKLNENPKLTIIIPAYNEIETIQDIINKIFNIKIDKQIILVDDHSSDGTKEVIQKNKDKIDKIIFHDINKGKGSAIKSAQKFVQGEYVVIQDADLEYDPNDLISMLFEIENKRSEVVYGSRVLNNIQNKKSQNFSHGMRIFGNIFLTKLSNLFNKQNLTDAHTCYKMFKSNLFKSIKLEENGFSFCPEITTKISLLNIEISEIAINYNGRSYQQGKKIKAIDGLKAIWTLIKYKFFK
ncbi:glycosyltransferase family 2 protein [Candidatus Pelagibacter sp.]|nr:glycosyltransferase family 2 protein [Candidatus Pelagibacter sp.]